MTITLVNNSKRTWPIRLVSASLFAASLSALTLSDKVAATETSGQAVPIAITLPLSYGPNIAQSCAMTALTAAVDHARSKGWTVSVAVVDTAGQLVALSRMDHAHRASPDFAIAKASSAAMTKRSTKVFSDALGKGRNAILGFTDLHVHAAEGGEVILQGERIIGGIGAAGVTQSQDREIALVGVAAATNC